MVCLATGPQDVFEGRLLKIKRGGLDRRKISTHFLSPFFAGFGPLFTNPARSQARLGRDNGKEKTTHSLSPSSLGLEKLSSQTQHEYERTAAH
jgi:hypothetical protein